MLSRIFIPGLICFLLATAGFGQRVYVGGSLGSGFQNKQIGSISTDDFKLKGRKLAWKAYGGVNWRFLGLEGGYRDFGEIEDALGDSILVSRTRGGDLLAKGSLHIAFLEIFGKAGGFFKRTENSLFKGNEDLSGLIDRLETGTDFIWGVGLGLNLGTVGLRVEWEQVQANPSRLSMLSFGANIGFGYRR